MKRICVLATAALLSATSMAQTQNGQIIKKGFNFGPLPSLAYDEDKGFEYGAILEIYNYGNGRNYPNYNNLTYLQFSRYTKGSQYIEVSHDNKELISGVRWSTAFVSVMDKAFSFYGYNGYQSYYDHQRMDTGIKGNSFGFTPFYSMKSDRHHLKSDFQGKLAGNLHWEVGAFANLYKTGEVDVASINKGKEENQQYPEEMPTLFGLYKKNGIIPEDEAKGGFDSGIRLGLMYDSRDKDSAPSSGIWAEAHVTAALPGISKHPYAGYSMTWRQYLPLIKNDVLTFAYRLNYEGKFGRDIPFYVLPYLTAMGEKDDVNGMGGYQTTRGIMLSRVVGLDMMSYNVELRWRPIRFTLMNQNFGIGLSAFTDGSMVTRGVDLEGLNAVESPVRLLGQEKDHLHMTVGSGLRFIMNENFIVALEYGTPISHFQKNSPRYNQDGTGAFYINIGYTF